MMKEDHLMGSRGGCSTNDPAGGLLVRGRLSGLAFALVVVAAQGIPTGLCAGEAGGKGLVLKSSRAPGAVDRVTIQIEAAGDRRGEIASLKAGAVKSEKKTPVEVACSLEFFEKSLDGASAGKDVHRSLRHYATTRAEVKIGDERDEIQLRDQRRYVVVESAPAITFFSPQGPLTVEEFDLLKQIGDSALLDRLLPDEPVSVGASWRPDGALVAALFGLDEVAKHDVTCRVAEITDAVVRFEIGGTASGRVNDAAGTIEVRGKFRFDRRLQRVDWMGVAAKVHCDMSAVWAEFDLAIRAQTRVLPCESPPEFQESKLAGMSLQRTPESLRIEHVSESKDWTLLHDRSWFATNYHRDVATLRLVRDGEYVAFASISLLPKRPAEQIPSLSEFQSDVKKALGKSFEELQDAGQSINQSRMRVLRVVVNGRLEESPRQWRYFHVTDPIGRQAVIAFNVEEKLAGKLDGYDTDFVNGFSFLPPAKVEPDKPASDDSSK